jgi:MFS family permease
MTHSTSSIPSSAKQTAFWGLVLPAVAILAITMGARQTTGLFLSPLNTSSGVGLAALSFALAIGQFVWGASQPAFGAFADKYGSGKVIVLGAILISLGTILTTQVNSQLGFIVALGVLSAAGAGAGSFSVLIGATAQHIAPEKRSFAAGLINAGGSFGQFIFAPFVHFCMGAFGWVKAMWILAGIALLSIPLAFPLRKKASTAIPAPGAPAEMGLKTQLGIAFKDKSYWCLHAGFFTCGFHIAFLVTHLPQEIGLCGLPPSVSAAVLALIGLANIAGSLSAGALGNVYRMKHLLFWMYFSRAVIIVVYALSAKTTLTFYIFAIALGLTWLATVPPTAGLVGKLFGTRYLATLFGFTLFSHQTGGFFGAWLGGLSIEYNGNYTWMWVADGVLALIAAFVNLPIKEAVLPRKAAIA